MEEEEEMEEEEKEIYEEEMGRTRKGEGEREIEKGYCLWVNCLFVKIKFY